MGLALHAVSCPLLVVAAHLPHEDRALQAAAALAADSQRPIVLLVVAHYPDRYHQLGTAASQALCERELPHTLLPNPVVTPQALIRAAREQHPGLLVLNRDCEILNEAALEQMVEELNCPIVLV